MYKLFLILRSLVFNLLLALTAFIFVCFMYMALVLPFHVRLSIGRAWAKLAILLGKWICGMDYEVIGKENLNTGAAIFLSRHESAWETIAFNAILPPVVFVMKKSLLMVPFFGWGMWITRQISIDRSQGIRSFKKVIEQGKDRLDQGLSIAIFPEGTRLAPGEHPPLHKTGAALAKSCGYQVIPISLNSGHCWPRNSFIKYPGKITVKIGPPIDVNAHSAEEINQLCYEWFKQTS